MRKPSSEIAHTQAYRKRHIDLYKVIRWNKTKNTKWDKDDIIKACRAYILGGTFKAAERATKIPYATISNWARKDWWPVLIEEVNYLFNIEREGQLSRVADRAWEETMDRLDNGDTVVIKGELVRKPVSARDAALVAAIATDKLALMRGDPTKIEQKNFNIDDRLGQLKEVFDDLAKRNEDKVVASIPDSSGVGYSFDDGIEDISEAELVEIANEVAEEYEEITEALSGTDS